MYEVQNRSVHEHELYSFKVERENLRWIYRANQDFISEIQKQDALDQMADHTFLKGYVFSRKMLSPKRLKGAGAFMSVAYLYV
jgi:hypothetical protein